MNAIHRVIQRRGNNTMNKEVDQYGTYIELENRIIEKALQAIGNNKQVLNLGGSTTDCQRIGGNRTNVIADSCLCNTPLKVFFVKPGL